MITKVCERCMSKIIAVLRKFASESGDLTALQGDVSSVSYREMLAAIDAIAAELGAQGIKRVGLVADNGPEWIIVDLACQCAGVPLIPLPAFFTPQQVSHAVDSSGVDALFSDQNGFGVTGKTLFGSRFSESSQPFSGLSAIKAYRVMPAAIDRVPPPQKLLTPPALPVIPRECVFPLRPNMQQRQPSMMH
jgi:hypothetical protein